MRCLSLLVVVFLAVAAVAQQPNAQEMVTREFGASFKLAPKFAPLFGDVDNDGQEDAIVVVTSETPLVDQMDFHFRAIDPYDSYWGWGNPRETVQFAATNAGPTLYIAVIHNWHAPKAKFLVINLPFEKLALSRVTFKKKPVSSIHAVEAGGLESDLYWDGKKYKWVPAYINNQ